MRTVPEENKEVSIKTSYINGVKNYEFVTNKSCQSFLSQPGKLLKQDDVIRSYKQVRGNNSYPTYCNPSADQKEGKVSHLDNVSEVGTQYLSDFKQ